jgi:hypothetical protein
MDLPFSCPSGLFKMMAPAFGPLIGIGAGISRWPSGRISLAPGNKAHHHPLSACQAS